MSLLLTKYDHTVQTIIIVPLTLSPFMSVIVCTSGRLHSEPVCLLFLQVHRETDRFFADSGVQLAQLDRDQFHYHRVAFSSQIKSKVGNILGKVAVLLVNLIIDGAPLVSRSHTHPSHSQTSRLLILFLSLGVPVPRSMVLFRNP